MLPHLNHTCNADWLDFTRQLPDECIDLYLSDPAYDSLNRWAGVGTTARLGLGRNGSGSDDKAAKFFATVSDEVLPLLLTEVYRVLKPERHAYLMCDFTTLVLLWRHAIENGLFGTYQVSGVTVPRGKALIWDGGANTAFETMVSIAEAWLDRLRECDRAEASQTLALELFGELGQTWGGMIPHNPLVWDKIAGGMGYSYRATHEYILFLWKGKKRRLNDLGVQDVLRFKRIPPSQAQVPTQKPDPLFETLVRQSTQPGELVLDNFMGSGTTARACAATGRNWLGCDIDPTHVELANAVQFQMEMAA